MRFALTLEHRDFYAKNGYIEFEGLLTAEQIASLQTEIDSTLVSRLKISPHKFADQTPKAIFDNGFDLWRANAVVKKTLFRNTLSDIAAQLFLSNLLRMGFDQYIDTRSGGPSPITAPQSFQQFSCAKPLTGALILRLSEPTTDTVDISTCPIPTQAGRGIYLSPEKAIDWDVLFSQKNLRLLILTYATKRTLYHLEKNDPHTHLWKGLGYVFGDRLNDSVHPILYRA